MHILIPIIDTLRAKNGYQLRGLHARGYEFTILTPDSYGTSSEVVEGLDLVNVHICQMSSRFAFLKNLFFTLRSRRFDLAELYPDSYLHLLVAILLKIARVPILIVARGAELKYVNQAMPLPRRIAFRLTYALADAVLYKEPYMADMLTGMKSRKPRYFLPNSIELPDPVKVNDPARCHFLYLNRIIPPRHPELILEAFIELCRELGNEHGIDIRLDIVGAGLPGNDEMKERQLVKMLQAHDVPAALHPWTNDPGRWLDQTDVFLLPADVVFLNYALLEAMGRGIPAITSEVQGADRIVMNRTTGFTLSSDRSVWSEHMKQLCLDPRLRESMGHAARDVAARDFSLDSYLTEYMRIYETTRRASGRRNAKDEHPVARLPQHSSASGEGE